MQNRQIHGEHFDNRHEKTGEVLMCMSSDGECRILVEVAAGFTSDEEQQFLRSTTEALETLDRYVNGRATDIFAGLHIKIGEDIASGGAEAAADENMVLLNGRKMLMDITGMRRASGSYDEQELSGFPDQQQPGAALKYTLIHEIGHILDGRTRSGEAYHRVAASESPTKYGREFDKWHTDNKDHEAFAEGFAHLVWGMSVSETMETAVRGTINARLQEAMQDP